MHIFEGKLEDENFKSNNPMTIFFKNSSWRLYENLQITACKCARIYKIK